MNYPEHGSDPISELWEADFLPACFPQKFPHGRQCVLKAVRARKVTPVEYWKHLLRYKDGRFVKCPRLGYSALNMMHRHRVLDTCKVYSKRQIPAGTTAQDLADAIRGGDRRMLDGVMRWTAQLRGTAQYWRYTVRPMLYAWVYFLAHEYDLAPLVFTTGTAAELHWPALHKLLDGSPEYLERDVPRPRD